MLNLEIKMKMHPEPWHPAPLHYYTRCWRAPGQLLLREYLSFTSPQRVSRSKQLICSLLILAAVLIQTLSSTSRKNYTPTSPQHVSTICVIMDNNTGAYLDCYCLGTNGYGCLMCLNIFKYLSVVIFLLIQPLQSVCETAFRSTQFKLKPSVGPWKLLDDSLE